MSEYVKHTGYGRIGRVVNRTARGDFEVTDTPRDDGDGCYGLCYWFRENTEPSTEEAWRGMVDERAAYKAELVKWAKGLRSAAASPVKT